MNKESNNHIAISTASGVVWDFVIPAEEMMCSEQATEMTTLVKQLFDTFETFLTPIELEYGIALYAEDRIPPFGDETVEPVETIRRKLRDETGVTASDFVTSTRVAQSGARFMPRIPISHNRLQMWFGDDDQFVDRTDCVSYLKGEPVNWEPTWDPIELVVLYVPNSHHERSCSEYTFRIRVSLHSDVWIEQTELGDRNREYLSQFLERIGNIRSVKFVEREVYSMSDFWIDLRLQQHSEKFDPNGIY